MRCAQLDNALSYRIPRWRGLLSRMVEEKVLCRKWLIKIFQSKWKSAGEGEAAKRRGRAGMFMKA